MYLLDTNIISDLVRNPQGSAAVELARVGDTEVATSVIVAGELRYGCLKRGSRLLTERVEAVLAEIDLLPLTPDAGAAYGEIRQALELRGAPIGQNDLWIAAQARASGAIVVTANEGEFRRIGGLRVENWLSAR
ncbi:type II toxin-antitoxin system VapC family toxin [Amaricoccus macauensis]|uniref:type II toxin-antitoxin system VapC family toxin n=1 Tax=Amaricoccus macauensis TaxID=57001 RepID=UPI003C7C0D55